MERRAAGDGRGPRGGGTPGLDPSGWASQLVRAAGLEMWALGKDG